MLHRRKIRGRYEPVSEPAEKNDQIVAEVMGRWEQAGEAES